MITSEVVRAAWEAIRAARPEVVQRQVFDEAVARWWLWTHGLVPAEPAPPPPVALPAELPEYSVPWFPWGTVVVDALAPRGHQVPAEVVERCAEVAVSPTRRREIDDADRIGLSAAVRLVAARRRPDDWRRLYEWNPGAEGV